MPMQQYDPEDYGASGIEDINQLRQSNVPSVIDRITQMFQPQTSAQTALSQALGNYPQRPEPTGMQKVLAALATVGQGGPAAYHGGAALGYAPPHNIQGVYDANLYGDYDRKVQDWMNQVKPLEYAANQERYYNTNQRQLAEQTTARETQRLSTEERERHNKAMESAVQFKQEHPDWKPVVKSGKVVFYNPKDPTQTVNTDIDSGKMSDYDKMNLGLNIKLQEIQATGDVQSKNIQERGDVTAQNKWALFNTKDENGKDITVRVNQVTGEVQPVKVGSISRPSSSSSAAGNKPPTPEQQKVDSYNRAQKAFNEHPEWSDYIKLAPGNNFVLTTPPWYKGGKDKATFDAVHDAIYGSQSTQPANQPQQAQPKVGDIKKFPNGRTGKWDGKGWVAQ